MSQVILVTDPAGAIEYTWPTTITAKTGEDITADAIEISLGGFKEPGTWVTPDLIEHPTPQSVEVSMLLDDTTPPGTYWVWIRLTDTPERVPRQGARITVI